MLRLQQVSARYGSVPAISNVSIEIGEGEAVGLLGANGAGKSTTLRAISGLVKLSSGNITFAGDNLASFPPHLIPQLGIAHVPEGRQVFPEMTVNENLEIGAYVPKAKAERSASIDVRTSSSVWLRASRVRIDSLLSWDAASPRCASRRPPSNTGIRTLTPTVRVGLTSRGSTPIVP